VDISNVSVDAALRIEVDVTFVEMEGTRAHYAIDISDYQEWSKNNPLKTVIDYFSSKLLPIYDAHKIAYDLKKAMEPV